VRGRPERQPAKRFCTLYCYLLPDYGRIDIPLFAINQLAVMVAMRVLCAPLLFGVEEEREQGCSRDHQRRRSDRRSAHCNAAPPATVSVFYGWQQ
jgi:hypothetical protein